MGCSGFAANPHGCRLQWVGKANPGTLCASGWCDVGSGVILGPGGVEVLELGLADEGTVHDIHEVGSVQSR